MDGKSLGSRNVIGRFYFLFQEGNVLVEHGHHCLKLSHLLIYRIDLRHVIVEASVFLVQLLYKDSQTSGNVTIVAVLPRYAVIHLLKQSQLIVSPLKAMTTMTDTQVLVNKLNLIESCLLPHMSAYNITNTLCIPNYSSQ